MALPGDTRWNAGRKLPTAKVRSMTDGAHVLHPDFLPVTAEQLDQHFAPIVGDKRDRARYLSYYAKSLAKLDEFERRTFTRSERRKATVAGRQIEKDERFWITGALLAAFHPDDGGRPERLGRLLQRAFSSEAPPASDFVSWTDALTGPLALYFEANVPAPPSYREYLSDHLSERVLVRYQREAAERAGTRLEGATKLDAVLVAEETKLAVVFEAKVLSDISTMVGYDVLRNQLARTIDVTLDEHPELGGALKHRRPDLTYVALLTPEIFRHRPHSRLYGHLYQEYRDEPMKALRRDLPHREQQDWSVVAQRLGWLTYQDCRELVPGSCGWLETPQS